MANRKTSTSTEVKRRYNEAAYDRIELTVPKGRKAQIAELAKARGMTANGLLNELLRKELGIPEEEWKTYNNDRNESLGNGDPLLFKEKKDRP